MFDWAIVELMGHVRMAGRVTEEEHFGSKLGRVDIPDGDGWSSHFFGGGSVYRITPTTEAIARGVARHNKPQPVHRWELPEPEKATEIMDGPGRKSGYYDVSGEWQEPSPDHDEFGKAMEDDDYSPDYGSDDPEDERAEIAEGLDPARPPIVIAESIGVRIVNDGEGWDDEPEVTAVVEIPVVSDGQGGFVIAEEPTEPVAVPPAKPQPITWPSRRREPRPPEDDEPF